MSNIDYNLNDDLSDLLGQPAASAARQLPTDAAFTRIRETTSDFVESCLKCGGSGKFRGYNGRVLGDCFSCKGKGSKSFRTAPEQRQRAQQRTQQAKVEAITGKKVEIEWLYNKLLKADRLPEGYANMLRDFLQKLQAGRELTDGQLGVIVKGMARDADYAANRQQQVEQRTQAAPEIDVSKLVEAFAFRAKNAKKAILRFVGVTLSLKSDGVTIYVKSSDRKVEGNYGLQGEYLGKIVEGRFIATRACQPADVEALKVAAADPLVAAVAYGRATSSCSCCGLTLTNALSIELGIGPICRSKWGF